ncbi:MAG: FG-GAP repeat protein [Microcystis aeruginosa]
MLKTFTSCLLALGATSLVGVSAPAQAFTPLSLTKTFNNPTPEDYDGFGYSVSLSGTSALIGAALDNTGALYAGSAYLYQVPQTVPEPSFTILGAGVVLGALPVLKKGKKTKDKDA